MWRSKRHARRALALVSGGIDSQCSSLILKHKAIRTKWISCVLHNTRPMRRAQVELANAFGAYGLRAHIAICFNQFRYFVKLTERRDALHSTLAPCINCNEYLKTAVCTELSSEHVPITGHYLRLLKPPLLSQHRIADSINELKSQLYFVSNDIRALFPLGFLYKIDVKQLHARFKSELKQSHDLCYERRARRRANANAFGCWTSGYANWQTEFANAFVGFDSTTLIKTGSRTQPFRAQLILSSNIRALRTNRKLYTGQRIQIALTSNRNSAIASSLFVFARRFGARLKRLQLNLSSAT
ncbi:putative tRNA (5-methylaminomethyl-2-thiouridylate)-methyltransferase [Candidatus Hodgkinia cicadicola]|nr:putative tRNA (5-methylaminomethyl-2-thiouridylate)-methyltransferase [Candidatus Hodgkinia cicadicola]